MKIIVDKYLGGKSCFELSKEFNVSENSIRTILKNNNVKLRRIQSEETKRKISNTLKMKGIEPKIKNNIPWNKGKKNLQVAWNKDKKTGQRNWVHRKFTSETINRIKEFRAKQILPLKDSSIEIKIQNFLKELGIEFFTHQHMNITHDYQCDIFIPSMNLVIECDGDYWHKYPIGRDIDKVRTEELIEKGFKVLRLWEFEINNLDIDTFKKSIDIYKIGIYV